MTLGGVEVDQSLSLEMLLVRAGSNRQRPLQEQDESMLVDLMVVEALALGQRQHDHPSGVVVRAKYARRVGFDDLRVKVPAVHPAGS